jgi:membrane associated rhomboid family serine protease
LVFVPLGDDAPRRAFPLATLALAAANVIVFAGQQLLPGDLGARLLYSGGAVPYEIARFSDLVDGTVHPPDILPPPLTILSSMFLHGGVEHLVGNVWFLWVFGRGVEGAMGRLRFLVFYLAVGVLAVSCQVAMTPSSRIPIVGASGAIAGVLGAYLLTHPRVRVQLLLFLLVIVEVVTVPAFVALGVWLLWQLVMGTGDDSVAVWAHVGGFLLGAASCKLFARRPRIEDAVPAPAARAPRLWFPPRPANGSSSSPP